MTNFEKITETPEALGEFLDRLPVANGPWNRKFHEMFCDYCEREDCDEERCPHQDKRYSIVFFCHPYSAYERGSNENMNRLIRRFFPKGTNFDEVTKEQVAEAERWVNDYPRKLLGWKSASDLFNKETQAA